jgi:hypothetical protein
MLFHDKLSNAAARMRNRHSVSGYFPDAARFLHPAGQIELNALRSVRNMLLGVLLVISLWAARQLARCRVSAC